jgi:hypothetical protein
MMTVPYLIQIARKIGAVGITHLIMTLATTMAAAVVLEWEERLPAKGPNANEKWTKEPLTIT